MHNIKLNSTRIFSIIAIALVISFVFSQFFTNPVYAAIGINRQINFQGKLVNNPLSTNVSNTSYTVVFTLYDDPDAGQGTVLWQETQSVTTVDGIFRVALGSVTPFPANFNFNWDGLYLGIKVNADSEMTPRIQMAAVPFAFNAEKVAGLTVQDTSGNASTSGILQVANGKTVSFADAFTTSGTNPLTLTTTGTTNVTLPTTGTLLTNTASANQTITSTQTTGNIFSLADSTGLSGGITGFTIGLTSSTNSQNKTGISFDLSGGTGGTYYDLLGTGSTWSLTRAGVLTVASCSGCGSASGVNWWNQLAGALSPLDTTNDFLLGSTATSSALFSYTGVKTGQTIASVSGSLIVMPNNGYGNVGINTTTPREKLQVVGNLEVGAAASGAKSYRFRSSGGALDYEGAGADMYFTMWSAADFTGTQEFYLVLNYDSHIANAHGDWIFQTGNTGAGGNTVLSVNGDSSGNVGVRTNAPNATLHIIGQYGSNAAVIVDQLNNGNLFTASYSGATRFVIANTGAVSVLGGQTSDIDTLTNTTLNIGSTNATTITLGRSNQTIYAAGNLGVGTSSPIGAVDIIGSLNFTAFGQPSGAITAAAGSNGNVDTGLHSWKVTFVTADGAETTAGALSNQVNSTNPGKQINLTNIPTGPLGTKARNIYRTVAGDTGNYLFVLTISDNTTTSTTDNVPDASLGSAAPTVNTTAVANFETGGTTRMVINNNGKLGVGTNGTSSIGNGQFIVNQTNNSGLGDIFAASSGGTTKFVITNGGNISLFGTNPSITNTGSNTLTINSGSTGNIQWFSSSNSLSSTGNLTLAGTTGITLTGNAAGIVFSGTGISTFSTAANQHLALNPAGTGFVGINTDGIAPLANFDVRANVGTVAIASVSGRTSYAGFVVDNAGNAGAGDLFTASASGATRFIIAQNGTVTIGNSTDGLVFNPVSGGPTYSGNARPSKVITLSAEYPGAVLTASGSATINGSMTSDASSSAALSNFTTYYEWSSTQTSLQDYTVAVRVKLPQDFGDFDATANNAIKISFNTASTVNTTNKLDVFIYNADTALSKPGNPVVYRQAQVSGTGKTWTTVNIDRSDLIDNAEGFVSPAAGDVMVIYLKMYASGTYNYTQVGDIVINYKSIF